MPSFGIIECFYGLAWAPEERRAYARFLREIGFTFYIYAPKADGRLRKNWRMPLAPEDVREYAAMRSAFKDEGLQFGMAISPQGVGLDRLSEEDRRWLGIKVESLRDIGIDTLGVFFDDMKSFPEMAKRQLEVVAEIQSAVSNPLLFCPSYYSDDSLLDMLFGDRPPNYLQTIGEGLAPEIAILWTGEQIISERITREHLARVESCLRRKPFICDNFFANDGPLNCNFIKPVPISGRERNTFEGASGWAFNPMNQPNLSKIVLLSFSFYFNKGLHPLSAFEKSVNQLCSPDTARLILSGHKQFAEEGLDHISAEEKSELRARLMSSNGPIEQELLRWLDGQYRVGFEAVIDQSGYEE